jgi:PAS domain S-box-containing protein
LKQPEIRNIGNLPGNAIVEAIPECVKMVSTEGTILYINKAGLLFIDADSADNVIGENVYDLIAPGYKDLWKEMNQRVCAGEELDWEYEIISLKGIRRRLATHAVPHIMPDGSQIQLAITKDITDKRKAEQSTKENQEKLEASETRFRTLADKIQSLAWMADAQGNINWYNSSWYAYTGTTLREMAGSGWQKLHHPEHIAGTLEFLKTAWNTNKPFEIQHPLRGKDGNYHWFLSQATPIADADGNIIEWMGTLTDIDEQKRGEERFRLLADEAPLWVWLTNKNASLDYANKEMLHFFELSSVGGLNRDVLMSYVHDEDLEEVTCIVQEGYANRQGYALECRLFNPRSRDYDWFAFKAVPRITEGKFDGFIGTATNISLQKLSLASLESRVSERTQQLNLANLALQRSNDELQQFAHVASHDLKEPVRKICIFTNLLQEQLKKGNTEKAISYTQKVEHAAMRMAMLIEGILQYSSVDGQQQERMHTDLNQILHNVEADLELALQQKNARIVLKDSLPVIEGMPILLQQLFYNIINNALKFAKEDVPPVIEISTGVLHEEEIEPRGLDPQHRYVTICIRDNGIGFDQCNAKNIFRTYYRLNSKDEYEGTGLGLALCLKIAERHGGTIEAAGVAGEGALFKVILPVN